VTTKNARETAHDARPAERTADSQFERVFVEQYPRILNVLVRLVGERAEAEDLALETFWRLWLKGHPPGRSRPTGSRADDNLGGWLYRVATHLGLNALRARGRRARYEQAAGQAVPGQHRPDDPAEAYAAQETREAVRRVLADMETRQAQLLLLRHAGLSYEELAAAVGVAPGSVGTLLARAEREFEKRYHD